MKEDYTIMKRLLLSVLFILCLCFNSSANLIMRGSTAAAPSISYDTSSSAVTVSWGSTISWSHTVTTESNSVVIAVVSSHDGNQDLSECNWDQGGTPVAMTALTSYGSNNQYIKAFYLLNPAATGARTIQCTAAGNATLLGAAISIYGATETGSGTTNHDGSAVATSTSISDTLTTGTNKSWVITAAYHAVNEDISTTQGETERVQKTTASSGGNVLAIATEEIAVAGGNTFGWSGATSTYWGITMMEFEPL